VSSADGCARSAGHTSGLKERQTSTAAAMIVIAALRAADTAVIGTARHT
jgi:hypothetical protein